MRRFRHPTAHCGIPAFLFEVDRAPSHMSREVGLLLTVRDSYELQTMHENVRRRTPISLDIHMSREENEFSSHAYESRTMHENVRSRTTLDIHTSREENEFCSHSHSHSSFVTHMCYFWNVKRSTSTCLDMCGSYFSPQRMQRSDT